MSSALIALVGMIYGGIAIEQFWRGDPMLGVVFTGYAFSNVGLFFMARAS